MYNRREFVKHLGFAGTGLAALGLTAFDLKPRDRELVRSARPIRIRGKVAFDGKGIPRVAVTDGFSVVQTDRNGNYELISDSRRDFVYMSVPSGYEIPQQQNGSAAFFKKIDASASEYSASFALKPSDHSDEKHHFLVLSDTQIQDDYEAGQLLNVAAPDVAATVKAIGDPNTFGIGCGDLVFDELHLFKEYNEAVRKMAIPFWQVLGNHDMDLGVRSDEMTTATFNSHFGPAYYSFNRGEIHYVILDDVFFIGRNKQYIGYITEQQLSWLENDLSFVEPGTTVVVALHIPLETGALTRYPDRDPIGGTVSNREQLYKLLEPFNTHVMSGHTHFNDNMKRRNVYEHCHGTVCGAWWSGPICYDGTPNGYGVYSVNGSQISWRYKATGEKDDHQFRVYEPGRHPDYKTLWCANVWNWDEDWKVCWYEDGIRKGEMLRITAFDPLSIELHKGPELPSRRTWVEPQLNDHMFFFNPDKSAGQVVVEVTDPFGNVYKEVVKS